MDVAAKPAGRALVRTFTLCGVEALPVEVEASVDSGYPRVTIVGLPDTAVRESLDRILAAFHSCGFPPLSRHVTVNLAPAELRKAGAALDLPIALAILGAAGAIPPGSLEGLRVAGELSLDGAVRPVRGGLAMACACRSPTENRSDRLATPAAGPTRPVEFLLPASNLCEVTGITGVMSRPVHTLADAVRQLRTGAGFAAPAGSASDGQPVSPLGSSPRAAVPTDDLSEVRGQHAVKRALEVAAAGGHNLLLVGPPGTGKTLLARRLPGILPGLSEQESIEVTIIHSVAGLLAAGEPRRSIRPFRAPHHTITGPGLVGGGAVPRPGEASLAHHGVLFLDEMAEFRPQVLDLLRQPLEEGCVNLVRSGRSVVFPSRFMLVGAMNPCMCGFLGHPRRPCRCTPNQVKLYRNRLSGPLLDRIDMHVEVPVVATRELTRGVRRRRAAADAAVLALESGTGSGTASGTASRTVAVEPEPEASAAVRARVVAARRIQNGRLAGDSIPCNAQMGIREIEHHCRIDDPTRALLHKAMETRSMSARAAHRVLRVARTIADLAGSDEIALEHVAEAVQYQALDRGAGG